MKSTKKPIVSVSSLRILTRGQPDKWARSDKEKAEHFAVHLSKVFTPNHNQPDQEIEEKYYYLTATYTTHKDTFFDRNLRRN
jgi:hypothetical protein